MHSNTTRVFSLSLALTLLAAASSQAGNLIVNGDFETGSIAGWTAISTPFSDTAGSCNNGFAAQSSATGCASGFNPISGTFAAYSSTSFPAIANNVGEWANYLNQDFVYPTGAIGSAILSWSDSAVWTHGNGALVLVQLYAGSSFISNQYSVLNPGGDGQEPWTNHTWDVTSPLTPYQGQTLTLKLTSISFFDSRGGGAGAATSLNAGFDNVALNVSAPTPEPATIGLTGVALVGLGLARRRLVNPN